MKKVLDDLAIFCAVVETGSLKKASEKLMMPHSTVSRRIEALENSLGLVLLHRSTRDVQVSALGKTLYQDCAQLIESIGQSINMAVDDEVQFRGKLNVSAPVKAGIDFLGGWLIDFATQHPELSLDISLSNTNKNLIKDDIDLAFRVGPLVDSSAIALHLWDIPYAVCCHQSFLETHQLKGKTLSQTTLESLPTVISRPAVKWAFVDSDSNEHLVAPNQSLTVDDLGVAYHAILSGQYLGFLPSVMIQSPDIVTLDVEGLSTRTRSMYAYYMGRRHAQSQIKHLIDYIKKRYHDNV